MQGLTATAAATIYVPMAMTTSLVVLGSGILVDRIPARFLLAMALVMQAGSLLMAQTLSSVALAFAYGVILGTTSGLESTRARGDLAQLFRAADTWAASPASQD